MPLPKEVLDVVAENIEKAEAILVEAEDVVRDMRLAGLDTTKRDVEISDIKDHLRRLRVFYERQKAKSS